MLADMKKGRIFALVINNTNGYKKNKKSRCCSSVWLECLPVTQEVASSSLVSTAESLSEMRDFFVLYSTYQHISLRTFLRISPKNQWSIKKVKQIM